MINPIKYIVVVFVVLCALAACTQERQACLTPKRASLKIKSVLPTTDNKTTDTPLRAALFIPLTGDTTLTATLYNKQSNFKLSLSPVADSCLWLMATDTASGSLFDTLTFHYNRQLQFLSNACGYVYFYSISSVQTTHNNIDSVLITNATVNNNVSTNHLQVFIRH